MSQRVGGSTVPQPIRRFRGCDDVLLPCSITPESPPPQVTTMNRQNGHWGHGAKGTEARRVCECIFSEDDSQGRRILRLSFHNFRRESRRRTKSRDMLRERMTITMADGVPLPLGVHEKTNRRCRQPSRYRGGERPLIFCSQDRERRSSPHLLNLIRVSIRRF